MPKIIENLENKLIAEACRQIEEVGYGAVTIRSIAKACGVGVGTVYNYFPSKDDLLAHYLLADWTECITAINAVSTYCDTHLPVLRCIYDNLQAYLQRHHTIFQDPSAAVSFVASFNRHHYLLRTQLGAPLRKFCEDDFTAEFIAANLLIWTVAKKDFDDIYRLLRKHFIA